MIHALEQLLHGIVEYSVVLFAFVGVVVLIISGISGFFAYLQNEPVHLPLSKGLALGLEFLLIGEILETVVIHELQSLVFIGGLCVVRMFIALILNHEIEAKQEAKMHKQMFLKKLSSPKHEETEEEHH